MLKFKTLTMKNFMSIGAVTQTIDLNSDTLNLVLGENLDLGGEDSRNGVGKSSILNALSFVIYDQALTKIRKDNLINKTNSRDMIVTLDFEKDGTAYRIERGRRKNVLRFWVNDREIIPEETDEAQGDSRVTQVAIEETIGLSHIMFKNIVGLNTYSEPFLAMRPNDQREVIEQLLGITKLSEKAELLKVLVKNTRDSIKEEEYKIQSIENSNNTIEKNINQLKTKSSNWLANHEQEIVDTYNALEKMRKVDIDQEISNHKLLNDATNVGFKVKEYTKEIKGYEREIKLYQKNLNLLESQTHTEGDDNTCHTCGQEIKDEEKHRKIQENIATEISYVKEKIQDRQEKIEVAQEKLDSLDVVDTSEITTFYDNVDLAYEHKSSMEGLEKHLESLADKVDPYTEQIESLQQDGLQKIDYDHLNDLISLKDHQEFLLKLLTNKDSFIRKKIIDQNLNYLNARLEHYLRKIGLPHEVKFLSDLSVDITDLGRELDFDNLSRGERTRLILSLSWSFRDVYESLNSQINLLFIDELMDNGLDTNGVESSLSVLKGIVRDSRKSIFLISHKEELLGRVDNIVNVVKENGFTSIEQQN